MVMIAKYDFNLFAAEHHHVMKLIGCGDEPANKTITQTAAA
jgi:hypothetical protein